MGGGRGGRGHGAVLFLKGSDRIGDRMLLDGAFEGGPFDGSRVVGPGQGGQEFLRGWEVFDELPVLGVPDFDGPVMGCGACIEVVLGEGQLVDSRFVGEDRVEHGANGGLIERGESPLTDPAVGAGGDKANRVVDFRWVVGRGRIQESDSKLFGFALS